MQSALTRLLANVEPAIAKLAEFTAEISPAGRPAPAA
jgi:hypothetical protein